MGLFDKFRKNNKDLLIVEDNVFGSLQWDDNNFIGKVKINIFNSNNLVNIFINTKEKKIDDIQFGINRKELWDKVGKPIKSFRKTIFDKVDTDDYKYFHIFYDNDYNFEAIEIFENIDINFNGYKLSKNYSEVLDYFKGIYDDIEEDGYGFISKKGSVGAYIENDDNRIDSILFGCQGYYNK